MKKIALLFISLTVAGWASAQTDMLYGLTIRGGNPGDTSVYGGKGVLYSLNPANDSEQAIIHFTDSLGIYPQGNLLKGSNGLLYGFTSLGGINNAGTLFNFNPANNQFTIQYQFPANSGCAGIIQGKDSIIYCLGGNSNGQLFSFNQVTKQFKTLMSFNRTNGMLYPYEFNLLQAPDGNVYGTTSHGGTNDSGVFYRYNPVTGKDTVLLDFGKIPNSELGYRPGNIWQINAGFIYGQTAIGGGSDNIGALFSYNMATGKFTAIESISAYNNTHSIHIFNHANYIDPKYRSPLDSLYYIPTDNGNLIVSYYAPALYEGYFITGGYKGLTNLEYGANTFVSNGYIYGTVHPSITDHGKIYKINTTTGELSVIHNFNGYDGSSPSQNGLAEVITTTSPPSSPGTFYAITDSGGSHNKGVLFSIDPSKPASLKTQIDFTGTNGANPYPGIIQASDGLIYGLTRAGGLHNSGTLYNYNPANGKQKTLLSFNSANNNPVPLDNIVQGKDGLLYFKAWAYNPTYQAQGLILMSYDISSGHVDTLVNNTENYTFDVSEIMQAKNGQFYTEGKNYYSETGFLTSFSLQQKTYTNDIAFPPYYFEIGSYAPLVEARDGLLLGLVTTGFSYGAYVYQYSTASNMIVDSVFFQRYVYPSGYLLPVSDTLLYGMCQAYSGLGNVYKCNLATHTITMLSNFNYGNGLGIAEGGGLVYGSDSLLYGLTIAGGTKNKGVLFSLNPVTQIQRVIVNFDSINGSYPFSRLLLLKNVAPDGINSISETVPAIKVSPSPGTGVFSVSLTEPYAFIKVYDITGKEIYSLPLNNHFQNQTIHLNLSNYPDGIYIVKAQGETNIVTQKIILQR